jgi:Reverse transcriptase (RNA-dependent DNA polymerase)
VDRIRNFHIYEANYNGILKINEVKQQHWQKHSHFHHSQHGSRKGKTSLDSVAIKLMQQEITRMAHNPYIQIHYDAQACYNRIIPETALTVSSKYGVHNNILKIFKTTLQDSKYYIKLGTTETSKYYNSSPSQQLFGTGQGSGCSPLIWLMISTELFQLYTENAKGASIVDPYQTSMTHLHMTVYVDNVNTHHSFNYQLKESQMIQQVTQQAQKCYDILYAPGGKLSTYKCSYYITRMVPQSTGRFKHILNPSDNIIIRNQDSENIIIKKCTNKQVT